MKDVTKMTDDEIASVLDEDVSGEVSRCGGEFNCNEDDRRQTNFLLDLINEAAKRLRARNDKA